MQIVRQSMACALVQGAAGVAQEALDNVGRAAAAAHLLHMHAAAAAQRRPAAAAKAATSLLRYVAPVATGGAGGATASVVPVDKALYLAGTSWQQARTL